MRKQCAVCPETFEAKRESAKYCSPKCRKRASRQHPPAEQPVTAVLSQESAVVPFVDTDPAGAGVLAATIAELDGAGRLESALGQAAIALARRIDDARSLMDTGSAYAALIRQHGETLTKALDGAKRADDALDELRARRERKQHAR